MFRAFRRGIGRPGTIYTREQFEAELARELRKAKPDDLAKITKAIGQATRRIIAELANMESGMTKKLDELLDLVASQQDKIDSLITFTEGLRDQVKAAMGDVITPSQAMRIDQIFDAVKANSGDIDAAISANTGADTVGAVSGGPSFAEIKNSINTGTGEAGASTGSVNAPAPTTEDPTAAEKSQG